MADNWKARHPFAIGQEVYAKAGTVLPGLAAVTIHMRGEDDLGCWFGSRDFPRTRFACADFFCEPPEPEAADASATDSVGANADASARAA
jgi:hypothetical protein